MHHVGDCYDSLNKLTFAEGTNNVATHMHSKDREIVEFHKPLTLEGEVEGWLNSLTRHMQDSLRHVLDRAMETALSWDVDNPRDRWLFDYPAQVVITACLIFWTEETQSALDELEGGAEDAVKRYVDVCTARLQALIKLVQGELTKADRTKIIALITMDVVRARGGGSSSPGSALSAARALGLAPCSTRAMSWPSWCNPRPTAGPRSSGSSSCASTSTRTRARWTSASPVRGRACQPERGGAPGAHLPVPQTSRRSTATSTSVTPGACASAPPHGAP